MNYDTPLWAGRLRQDPAYSHIRLKRLEKGYPVFAIEPEMIDIVSSEDFFREEANRLPLLLGTQFGIHPCLNIYATLGHGVKRFAVLGRSALSGCIAGLSIVEIDFAAIGADINPRTIITHLNRIQFFSNTQPANASANSITNKMTLEIRSDLSIAVYTLPGSARIRWQFADFRPCMFDPLEASFHPYDSHPIEETLPLIPFDDLKLIKEHLLRFAEERRLRFAELNSQIK